MKVLRYLERSVTEVMVHGHQWEERDQGYLFVGCLTSRQHSNVSQGRTWARMHHKVVGNFGSEPVFEVCTTNVLDSIKLLTRAHVLTVNR